MAEEYKLPDLGENVEGGDVLGVLVKVGDSVALEQPLLELETDKAVLEVPANFAGRIEKILVNAGDHIKVGQTILSYATGGAPSQAGEEKTAAAGPKAAAESAPETPQPASPEASSEPEDAPAQKQPSAEPSESAEGAEKVAESTRSGPAVSPASVPAAPSVRRLAREIGVDIREVAGSGPRGRISRDDVKAQAQRLLAGGATGQAVLGSLPDFTRWGEVTREKMAGVRRATARQVARSWSQIPHVTQVDECDITELDERRKKYSPRVEPEGKLTVTVILLKVLAAAVRKYPQFGASLDIAREEVIFKDFVHVGVAVDTPRGLLVPVIRNVDDKNLVQLSRELKEKADRARQGKLSLDEMQGGCITVTNLGGIGGTSFTPIINWPEVAILGVSRASLKPVFRENEFKPRLIMPVCLSYDHRLIDGADAARFLRWICEALEDPFILTLEG